MKPVISDFDKYKRQQRRSSWIIMAILTILTLFVTSNRLFIKAVFVLLLWSAYGIGHWEVRMIQKKKAEIVSRIQIEND